MADKETIHKAIYAKFASPGRWIGITYFIFPDRLVDRALWHYDEQRIGNPRHYLDSFINATLDDWRHENPKGRYPVMNYVWKGIQTTKMNLLWDKRPDEILKYIDEFEEWFLPKEKIRMEEAISSWGKIDGVDK